MPPKAKAAKKAKVTDVQEPPHDPSWERVRLKWQPGPLRGPQDSRGVTRRSQL
jgi:hypothetical protein